MLKKLINSLANAVEFRSRIWVVHVSESILKDQSYVVNEDQFSSPLSWMKGKGYDQEMLSKVESMKRSQILVFELGRTKHQLMRVK
ncbi:hypothetical protein [Vibrio mediterranei]|uniref:Uncharacterized protein n=1 Tax=Vibrio mediterranei TaxID=689 RepID=A0ABX5DI73_9VIBR|nr:hypothetical protein [Vibrio mediterranei]PCD88696.1 hypothetical protein COR52_09795 [Vibrio mediterranei]PRQ67986.1 hypothetical protein COR51_10105 [Vibrio mediterranei]